MWVDEGRGRGSSLFDRLGVGFTLLRLGPKAAPADSLQAAAKRRGIPLMVIELPDSVSRSMYGRDLAIVRPDQHVGWRGNAEPADAEALWSRLTGAN